MTLNRRQLLRGLSGISVAGIHAQTGSEWGERIVDCHHHPRRTLEANTAHLDGAGINNAMLY
jgi:hypothetical protein